MTTDPSRQPAERIVAADFRSKPTVVQAVRYTRQSRDYCIEWIGPNCKFTGIDEDGAEYELEPLFIVTLEGGMRVDLGDWIVKGVKGEFYPVKPDIFALRLEHVQSHADQPASEQAKGECPLPTPGDMVRAELPASEQACPECGGSGKSGMVPVCVKPVEGFNPTLEALQEVAERAAVCSFCDGSGKVSPERIEWRKIGEQWRKMRRELRIGLRAWAAAVDCLPSDYCDMEAGRIKPDPKFAPVSPAPDATGDVRDRGEFAPITTLEEAQRIHDWLRAHESSDGRYEWWKVARRLSFRVLASFAPAAVDIDKLADEIQDNGRRWFVNAPGHWGHEWIHKEIAAILRRHLEEKASDRAAFVKSFTDAGGCEAEGNEIYDRIHSGVQELKGLED